MIQVKELSPEVKAIWDSLTPEQADEIYRLVCLGYVIKDVKETFDVEDDVAEAVASRYVYDGDYDCTSDYWTNLGHLVNEELEEEGSEGGIDNTLNGIAEALDILGE